MEDTPWWYDTIVNDGWMPGTLYYYYYYYYKCHGLECCHHTVAGALYTNLDSNCCTAQ